MKRTEVPLKPYQLYDDNTGSEECALDADPRVISRRWFLASASTTVLAFAWGVGVGYMTWGRTQGQTDADALAAVTPPVAPTVVTATPTAQPTQVAMPDSYTLPVAYGEIGPRLQENGAFTYEAFAQVYDQAGQSLTPEQQTIVREGSAEPITISHANAYFLLNFFWALGLTNRNTLLTEGTMVDSSKGQIEGFASTGGWPLATKPIAELYASADIFTLNEEQQSRLQEAASAVYRPCCGNPTSFPDCNHGMAMLGLFEAMAADDATVDQMLEAAKYVNRFWFPGQAEEVALFYLAQNQTGFSEINARAMVGAERFSRQGFASVHQWLVENGKLEQPSQKGSSCGV